MCGIDKVKARFALDNKMKNTQYGQQGASSKFPFPLGQCYKLPNGDWVKGEYRTVKMNYEDNQKWLDETGGNISKLKNYHNVQHKPFVKCSEDLIMLQAPISPLHD